MTEPAEWGLSCPLPHTTGDRILLAHGEGAGLTRRLIRQLFLEAFDNDYLRPLADAAVLPPVGERCVVTTDSFVVSPLFFPGGDIGRLAVHGTINDLAVCGAEPLYLCLSVILEEGLPLETLRRVVGSIRDAARSAGILVVAGDTKVVPRGAADQLFLTTTGIGRQLPGCDWGTHRVRPSDRLVLSGAVGDHGIAVLAAREGLGLGTAVSSDTAALHGLVAALVAEGIDIHFLRDATRGGVAAVLHEIAEAAGVSLVLDEAAVPIHEAVRGACEILGIDPLYVANEGKLLAVVAEADASRALAVLRRHPLGAEAALVGEVTAASPPHVLLRGSLGTLRVLDEPTGAPLPRIC
ncbi:MAG: hydrogenase expression/formation protein HypE [Gemmataceae bacterium]|nr:hydrogenase expression/formation protein HypE [Gemmataceae bacterium]MDW8267491.1 hydrogenase expression/formation protein HypE [Gemmataceae bacterium]